VLIRRSRVIPVLVDVAVGLLVSVVAWVYLFGQFIDVAPPRYPTFEAAKPVAVAQSGKHRWPGTSIRVHEIDAQRLDVERRWLGMRESVTRVEETQAGWDVGTPTRGAGRAAQEGLASVVPGVAVGWLVHGFWVTGQLRSDADWDGSASKPIAETARDGAHETADIVDPSIHSLT
jgi:hypothetical protein